MTLIERLFQYLAHKRLTPYTFERACGIANGYLKKQKKGKGTIGSEILEKISQHYSDLSLIWLVTGKGKMIVDSSYATESAFAKVAEAPIEYESAEATIRNLREKISILERALADKEKIISLLEQRKQ